jgi:PGF-CTERM protein
MTFKRKPSRAVISAGMLVVLLVLVSIVPAGVLAQSGGEIEPNDARATATPLKDSISGEIGVKGGVDWYSAQFTEGETVSFLVTKALREPDLEITLYGSKGDKLFEDASEEHDRRMQVAVTANYTGTYYVKVEASDTSKKEIPYVVRVLDQTATERSGEEGEPNDALPAATSLQNGYARSVLSGSGDVDWYSAQFTKGETVSFLITDREMNISESYITLYRPNITKTKEKFIGTNDTRVQIADVATQTGTYYVKVYTYDSWVNSSMSYTIRVTGQAAPPQTAPPTTTDTATSQTATLSTTTQTATGATTTSTTTTVTATSGTDTSAQTETSTSNSGTSSSANTPVEEETTSMFGPGFTSVGAIIALLSGVLFTVRRR